MNQIKKTANACDIIFVQEAHCGEFKEDFLGRCLEQTHVVFWSPCADTARRGGVGIIIKNTFLRAFPDVSPLEEIVPGCIAALRLRGEMGGLDLFTVHLDRS